MALVSKLMRYCPSLPFNQNCFPGDSQVFLSFLGGSSPTISNLSNFQVFFFFFGNRYSLGSPSQVLLQAHTATCSTDLFSPNTSFTLDKRVQQNILNYDSFLSPHSIPDKWGQGDQFYLWSIPSTYYIPKKEGKQVTYQIWGKEEEEREEVGDQYFLNSCFLHKVKYSADQNELSIPKILTGHKHGKRAVHGHQSLEGMPFTFMFCVCACFSFLKKSRKRSSLQKNIFKSILKNLKKGLKVTVKGRNKIAESSAAANKRKDRGKVKVQFHSPTTNNPPDLQNTEPTNKPSLSSKTEDSFENYHLYVVSGLLRDFRRNVIRQVRRKQLGDRSPINSQSNERNTQVCPSNPVKRTAGRGVPLQTENPASDASDSLCTEAVDLGHAPRDDAILTNKICCQTRDCQQPSQTATPPRSNL